MQNQRARMHQLLPKTILVMKATTTKPKATLPIIGIRQTFAADCGFHAYSWNKGAEAITSVLLRPLTIEDFEKALLHLFSHTPRYYLDTPPLSLDLNPLLIGD